MRRRRRPSPDKEALARLRKGRLIKLTHQADQAVSLCFNQPARRCCRIPRCRRRILKHIALRQIKLHPLLALLLAAGHWRRRQRRLAAELPLATHRPPAAAGRHRRSGAGGPRPCARAAGGAGWHYPKSSQRRLQLLLLGLQPRQALLHQRLLQRAAGRDGGRGRRRLAIFRRLAAARRPLLLALLLLLLLLLLLEALDRGCHGAQLSAHRCQLLQQAAGVGGVGRHVGGRRAGLLGLRQGPGLALGWLDSSAQGLHRRASPAEPQGANAKRNAPPGRTWASTRASIVAWSTAVTPRASSSRSPLILAQALGATPAETLARHATCDLQVLQSSA